MMPLFGKTSGINTVKYQHLFKVNLRLVQFFLNSTISPLRNFADFTYINICCLIPNLTSRTPILQTTKRIYHKVPDGIIPPVKFIFNNE